MPKDKEAAVPSESRILAFLNEILQMMALEYDEAVIFERLCLLQEEYASGDIAAILMYDESREHMYVLAAPSIKDLSDQTSEKSFITPQAFAWSFDLYEPFLTPIRQDEDEVIGVFLLASNREREVTEFQKELLGASANVVSIMLKKIKDRKKLDTLSGRLVLMDTMFDHLREGVIITDEKYAIVEVNRAFEKISGYREMEIVGYDPKMFSSGKEDETFFERLWSELKHKGTWSGEVWNKRKSGEPYPQHMSITDIRNAEGETTNYLCIFSDISDIHENQEKLVYMAYHDPLTGLANRNRLFDILDHIFKRSRRSPQTGALLFLDLNRFKNINDTYGHAIGDIILIHVANRLREVLRGSDTIARFGGDEFVILLEDMNEREDILKTAYKIQDAFKEPFEFNRQRFVVGGSIGIVRYPQDGSDSIELLKHADTAMYQAKLESGHVCFYNQLMTRRLQKSMMLESDMQSAVDNGEFEICYQPKFDVKTLKLKGAEALVRWNHPQRGRVMPSDFIMLAEEINMIGRIDSFVLKKTLEDLSVWNMMEEMRLDLSVNLSGRNINMDGIERLVSIIEANPQLKPQLILEITETFLVQSVDEAINLLQRLKSIGVRLAMDDFGTGYSSLAYLKRFNIDSIKIDRSLIRDIAIDSEDREIVKAILALGSSLGLDVVAEGIENKEQLSILQQCGCDEMQGFYFDEALSFEEFTDKYIRRRDD